MAVIGIDLGNNFARVAVLRNRIVEHIVDEYGDAKTPCVVAFTNEDKRLIGKAAKDQALSNPTNTIFNAKSLLGEKVFDLAAATTISNLPFLIDKSVNNNLLIKLIVNNEVRKLMPEEVIGSILQRMKIVAEEHLNTPVTGAVISVPACFNGIQRQAILDAGKIADLTILRLINEPTAAIVGHGYQNGAAEGLKLLFHLGGGSFDVSVIKATTKTFQVIATSGDRYLGGENITDKLMNVAIRSISNVNFNKSPSELEYLRRACEHLKIQLTSKESGKFEYTAGDSKTIRIITIDEFEELCKEQLSKMKSHLELVLKIAQLKPNDIDDVFLMGDSTKIPFIKSLLRNMFIGRKLVHLADDAVVRGCTVQAGVLQGEVKDLNVTDICANSIGLYFEPSWICLEIVPKYSHIPYLYQAVMYRCYQSLDHQLKIKVIGNVHGYKIVLKEYQITFPIRENLNSDFELKFILDANCIIQCSASIVMSDGEVVQLPVSDKSSNNMSETAIEHATNEMIRRHNFEENARRRKIARDEFREVLKFWLKPFEMAEYKDKYAIKFHDRFEADIKWLTTENENNANVVERRLEELKSICTATLEDAIANVPSWVKNLYDIKKK